MQVIKIEFSDIFAANCYFYIDEITKHGFIIDPSAHTERLLAMIKENNWKIERILLTHSHLDHIGAALGLSNMLDLPVEGHQNAKQYLTDQNLNMHLTDHDVLKNMQYLNDGDKISLSTNSDIILQMISTPGHTLDSVVYYDKLNHLAFTGDTIFASGIGRTDIPGSGGDEQTLIQSIQQKIFTLPENTLLYPGHGQETNIKTEKQFFKP